MSEREAHFRRLERMYADAPVNRSLPAQLRVADGCAEVALEASPDWFHSGGAAHGSLAFRALDDAAYFAAASQHEGSFLVTASFTLYFLRPVRAGRISASGRVVHRSRGLVVAESELTDARGRPLGRGSGTFMPSGMPLGPEVGFV